MGNITEGTDFFGKPVRRGDWVVFQEKNYRHFIFGKVIDITPKTFVLEGRWSYSSDYITNTRQVYSQVILVEEAVVPLKVREFINNPNTKRLQ